TLSQMGSGAGPAVPALAWALKDENPEVRYYAAKTLGKVGPEARSALPALKEAAKEKDPKGRDAAAAAPKKVESNKHGRGPSGPWPGAGCSPRNQRGAQRCESGRTGMATGAGPGGGSPCIRTTPWASATCAGTC